MGKVRELVIIGGGPSALTAAIYTTREDIDTVIYEKSAIGGLAAITHKVDNYPGFSDGIEGYALAEQLEKQAKRFGTEIEFGDVTSVTSNDEYRSVIVDGNEIKAKAVLIATGSAYVKTGVKGEAEYYGSGVHYCATCDGAFYKGRKIAVVGGGNSAIQETIFLTRFSSHIDLLVRSTIKASDVLQKKLQEHIDAGQITVHLGTTMSEIKGDGTHVQSVDINENGEIKSIDVDGVFVFAGLRPNTEFLTGSGVELDDYNFIKTDSKLNTNVNGVFACGDVRSGATMQIASAVGDGATVAHTISEYLETNYL